MGNNTSIVKEIGIARYNITQDTKMETTIYYFNKKIFFISPFTYHKFLIEKDLDDSNKLVCFKC